jgi:PAS domain S-box-containing protein
MAPRDKEARLLELQHEIELLRSELGMPVQKRERASFAEGSQHILRVEAERVAQLGTWSWDLSSGEVEWSSELYRILGLSPAEVRPSSERFFGAIHADDLPRVQDVSRRSLETGVAEAVDFRVVRPNTEIRNVRMEATFLREPEGSRRHVVGTLIDETDKRRAMLLIAQTVAELREAQQLAGLGSWRWYLPEGRVEWSEGMYTLLALSPDTRVSEALFYAHVHPDDAERVRQASGLAVESCIPQQVEFRMIRSDGSVRDVLMRSRATLDEHHQLNGFQGVIQDISERKALEDAARHAQKMEAIGTLAGGVAHDFNNYLMVLGGNVDLLALSLPAEHAARRCLGAIQFAYERCANLTEQLLTLSRKRAPQPSAFDLNARIEALAPMLRSALGASIALELKLERDAPAVYADAAQVEHALMNLALNARDGIGDGSGRVTVRVEGLFVEPPAPKPGHAADPAEVEEAHAFAAGFYVRLSISDTGCGIPAQLHSRIFEPFFTTKAVGKGTGLGLAVVYGIVREAGGRIEVESAVGEGTTFHLYFRPASSEHQRSEPMPAEEDVRGRGQRVLLVEDVAPVRELLRDQLVRGGYEVVTAADGVEALALLQAQHIDAVLTDVVMPKLGGVELVLAVRKLRPTLPCLLMSGYSTASLSAPSTELSLPMLRKPFSARQLRAALSRLLHLD